jgi:aspartyl protease family protein
MRNLLIIAAAVTLAAGLVARNADKVLAMKPSSQAVAVPSANETQQTSAGQHKMSLPSGRDGHFHVEARIDGRSLEFMVDTGASLVILRESDAGQIGVRPLPGDYTATVSTANGTIKAAHAKLSRIEIGDITVYDVPALVLPDEALGQNLLGVAFLAKLRRYEFADGRLLLEQ